MSAFNYFDFVQVPVMCHNAPNYVAFGINASGLCSVGGKHRRKELFTFVDGLVGCLSSHFQQVNFIASFFCHDFGKSVWLKHFVCPAFIIFSVQPVAFFGLRLVASLLFCGHLLLDFLVC